MEAIAAADVPPSVLVLILTTELSESDDGVLKRGTAERGALKISILNVDMVVELGVAFTADH